MYKGLGDIRKRQLGAERCAGQHASMMSRGVTSRGRETYRLYGVFSLAPRMVCESRGARTPFRAPAGRVVSLSHPTLPPQRLQQQLRAPRTVYAHVSVLAVCGRLAECLLVFSRAPLQLLLLLFFFFWILACLLPQRGKKKKGHVCLEKYVGQWNISCTGAKGEEGSEGGERRGLELRVCAPGRGPQAL